MKKIFRLSALCLLCFTACNRNNNSSPAGTTPRISSLSGGTGFLTFQIDRNSGNDTTLTYEFLPPDATAYCTKDSAELFIRCYRKNTAGDPSQGSTADLLMYAPFPATAPRAISFNRQSAETVQLLISFGNIDSATLIGGYGTIAGTLNITTFSAIGVEGNFSATAVDVINRTDTVQIVNGRFAGRFIQ